MRRDKFLRSALLAAGTTLLFTVATPTPAQAQFKKLKDKAKETATGEAVKKVEKDVAGAGGAVDAAPAAGEAVHYPASDAAVTADPGAPASSGAPAAAMKPGEGAWANYDFIPGETPLFVEDFSKDRVGNFPQRLEFVEGNMEIIEWQGRRFLRATTYPATFAIALPEPLPERYTLEFDIAPIVDGWLQYVYFADLNQSPNSVVCTVSQAGLFGDTYGSGRSLVQLDGSLDDQIFACRVMVDGAYAKVYQNEQRVANVPNAALGHGNRVTFKLAASVDQPVMIGAIRLMGGGRDLYDALEAEGRVTTQGILFDSGSDRLRPESTPTLREIAEMLTAHPELRVAIEGHTDADGDDAANQALSEKRAAAVKAFIVSSHGVDASRLEAAGFGESKPVADNATAEGKQQNRRVELVKLG
jgi:outer membrane protein OmpA-like peptidoglycan-associated protein